MRTHLWHNSDAARLAFEQMDRARRWRGIWLDSAGFAPLETPFRVVHEEPGLTLRRYGNSVPRHAAALVIIPAPIKRSYIWDLAPAVSAVRRCLQQGMRVYLAEWTPADGNRFGLEDYACRFPATCLDAVEADCGQRQAVLAGHSLGGTLAAIFACLHQQRIRGLVLLEAPLHFAGDAGKFAPAVANAPDAHFIAQMFGNVPGSFLNFVSVACAPAEFRWQRLMDFMLCAHDHEALANYMRVERWLHDEFALPGRLFAEVVELLYRNDRLMQGSLRVAGREVGPRDLTAPLLNVVDPRSGVVPPQSVMPFHEAAAARVKKVLHYCGDVGVGVQHVGVLVGANAHARIWPAIFDWLSVECGPH